jgi:beta-galactosidase
VATYATGYVNETDLVYQGGFPGPLSETLGVWCEEIDALYPEDRNAINWKGKSYQAFDLCELIHVKDAEVQAVYGSDFYAGRPALTVNHHGSGKAWFIAARTGPDFLLDFYRKILADCNIKPALGQLPPGVTAQVRSDGKTEYVFVMNFTPSSHNLETGPLGPWETQIIERPAQG